MADKVLIIIANSDPSNAQQMLTPLAQAMVAAAMEYDVEVIYSGRCVDLVRSAEAASAVILNDGRVIYDILKETSMSGVSLKVCTMALEVEIIDLVPEIEARIGGSYLIGEAMDDATETFTY